MWISKIELTNFKSYRHAEFSFPEPEGEQNIVLIGGINGYGKTSVLEALYLCLYGKDAIVHLARAGLKTDAFKGYPSFLERAFNGEARRDSEDVMSVRVVVQKTKTKGIDILRRWYFRTSTGAWLEDETVVREVTRGVPGLPKTDGKAGFLLSDMLDDHFVPAHVAPFFFFDGEEVKKLADQNRVEQVKQGLEGLLGVVLLRNLAERLKGFESSKRSGIANVDDQNIERMLEALTADEAKLDGLRADAEQCRQRLEELKAKKNSCRASMAVSTAAGETLSRDLVYTTQKTEDKSGGFVVEVLDVQPFVMGLVSDLTQHYLTKRFVGEWKGDYKCEGIDGATDGQQGPYSMPVALVVDANFKAKLERTTKGGGIEILSGDAGYHMRLRGEGKNSPDDTWRTEFDGQVQGFSYEAKGQVSTPEGQVLRQCQLKLALPSS